MVFLRLMRGLINNELTFFFKKNHFFVRFLKNLGYYIM